MHSQAPASRRADPPADPPDFCAAAPSVRSGERGEPLPDVDYVRGEDAELLDQDDGAQEVLLLWASSRLQDSGTDFTVYSPVTTECGMTGEYGG
jgi:hypothetical protein